MFDVKVNFVLMIIPNLMESLAVYFEILCTISLKFTKVILNLTMNGQEESGLVSLQG